MLKQLSHPGLILHSWLSAAGPVWSANTEALRGHMRKEPHSGRRLSDLRAAQEQTRQTMKDKDGSYLKKDAPPESDFENNNLLLMSELISDLFPACCPHHCVTMTTTETTARRMTQELIFTMNETRLHQDRADG